MKNLIGLARMNGMPENNRVATLSYTESIVENGKGLVSGI